MYPFERYMKTLKGIGQDERIVEETLDFCTGHIPNGDFIGIPKFRYAKRTFGEKIIGNQISTILRTKLQQTHLYVLHNAGEVEPYGERYNEMLKKSNPSKNENWISKEHN
ncbi:hypothetical protein Lal_00018626 [Lupinus albus]|nr:hypothetical protein Lal_00018626 [Lupinus albus]